MNETEAAMILRQATIDNENTAHVLAIALERQGYTDLYDWVEDNPKLAVIMAESELLVQEQLAGYARELEGGALGDSSDDEPAT